MTYTTLNIFIKKNEKNDKKSLKQRHEQTFCLSKSIGKIIDLISM